MEPAYSLHQEPLKSLKPYNHRHDLAALVDGRVGSLTSRRIDQICIALTKSYGPIG